MSDEIETLIQAALFGAEEEPELNGRKREVKSFIQMYGIKAADNPIAFTMIFEFFKKKCPKTHVGKLVFKRILSEHFTPYRTARGLYYRLDPISFGLPESYSIFTDKRFYPGTTGKSRKYGKDAKNKKETKEQE
jgi:hypothetical protein